MDKEKCIWCERAMGNSLNKIRHGKERNKYPIHKHCYDDNSIIKIFEKIEASHEETNG